MDRVKAMAEACVMTFEDFLEERGIDIPNDEKSQSPDSASTIYGTDFGDLVDDISHVIRMYQRFEEEDRTAGKPYRAERVSAGEHVDEWDAWSADTFPGWFIAGNGSLMEHGTSDPAWTGAMEILNSFDEFEAMETIADGYLAGEDKEEMQKILQRAYAAQAVDGNCWANLNRSSYAGGIAYKMIAYFHNGIIPEDEMIAYCLEITTGERYNHCEIHGCVQREWNNVFYPVKEAYLVETCEHMYFNLDEQFRVYHEDDPTPVLVTAYLANNEDEYLNNIADAMGCSPEEIDLCM